MNASGWTTTVALALAVGVVAFVFRITTFEISNDDYLHLSGALQILHGDVPSRDFIDPGEPLFYYVSAAAQGLLGQHVLSEVLLDVTALAVAYVFVFLLGTRLARSPLIALTVLPLVLLLVPRLYAYPKVLLYPVGLWLIWRYSDAPRRGRLWAVAGGTSVAFLFRHDHGAYIGVTMGVMILLVHAQEGWRRASQTLATFLLCTGALLAPYFLFLQLNGGIVSHFQGMLDIAQAEYERTVGDYPAFRMRLAVPRTAIDWAPDVDATTRSALADQYSLSAPEARGDGQWDYDLNDISRENLRALSSDPRVRSIDRFDRQRLQVMTPVTEPNRLAWFYYLTFAVAPLALLLTAGDIWRRTPRVVRPADRLVITAAVMSLVMNLYLMRSAAESAIGDVSALTGIVSAWLLARGLAIRPFTPGALARLLVTLVLCGGSLFFALRDIGGFALSQSIVLLQDDGWRGVAGKLQSARRLAAPFDTPVTQYIHACTAPTDRFLITGYAPEVYYGSGRAYAAGRQSFLGNFAPSARAKAFSLDRLMRERVPLVVVREDDAEEFSSAYAAIANYVQQNYRDAGEVGADSGMRVFADRRLTAQGTYGDTALPCFR